MLRALYHTLTHASSAMASMATNENHPMRRCPLGSTINAASSGPMEDPAFPPTENSSCATPCRPPEAMRAIRDASGWNTADPTPIRATANKILSEPDSGWTLATDRALAATRQASLRSDGVRDHPGMSFGFIPDSAFGQGGVNALGRRHKMHVHYAEGTI